MSVPWEKYNTEAKPWEKYANGETSPETNTIPRTQYSGVLDYFKKNKVAQLAIENAPMALQPNPKDIINVGVDKFTSYMGKLAPKVYESALKQSTALKPAVREARAATGIKERIPVSKSGFEKGANAIKDINKDITQRIKDLLGTTVSSESSLQPVRDLYKSIPARTITPEREQGIVAHYIKEVQESTKSNPEIPIQQAQVFKQTLNKELNEYYHHLSKGKISPEPIMAETKAAMATGLRQEIAKVFPEISALNQREASLIELNKSLGRAVSRIKNRELIPLAVQIASGNGSASAMKAILAKAIDQPYVKSQLAFAIDRASKANLQGVVQTMAKGTAMTVQPKNKDGVVSSEKKQDIKEAENDVKPKIQLKHLDKVTALELLEEAGGDKEKARKLAKERGYIL